MILIRSIQEESYKIVKCMFLYFSTASNVADDGEEDDSDDGEGQEQVVADTQDTQISDEMEDSQSSAGNSSQSQSYSNRVTTPQPLTPCRTPTSGKRMHYSPRKDAIEDKLLQIIEKQEKKPDEGEMFCLSLAATLGKIQDPQKKEHTMLQLKQTLYNCMYGSVVNLQPNVGQTQPQPQQVQVPMPLPQHQQNYNYTVNSDDSTFASFYNVKCL